jgi:alpha-D-xyloside xylohydrolase
MPYLWQVALEAHREGVPMMRAMLLEFPEDPACETLDRQYLLGGSLLVAPIFAEDGIVDYYLPVGRWTNFLTGQVQEGPVCVVSSMAFLVSRSWCVQIPSFPSAPWTIGRITTTRRMSHSASMDSPTAVEASCQVSSPKRVEAEQLIVRRTGQRVTATLSGESSSAWRLQLAGISKVSAKENLQTAADPFGIIIQAPSGGKRLEFEI